MALVVCDEVGKGFKDSERTVGVKDVNGDKQFLRVPAGYLGRDEAGRFYLPVGIVGQDRKSTAVLIELPHESDSGANRLWVWPGAFLSPVEELA